MTEGLDLEAYLARIGDPVTFGELDPTLETLFALHRAHVLSIPFENLDILLGRPIRLDIGSLQAPIRFDDEEPVEQGAWSFQLVAEEDDVRVLRGLRSDGWIDLYAFTEEPQLPVDYEVGNHYTSTWPRSPFVAKVVVERSGVDERWMMIADELWVERPHGEERWPVTSDEERLVILSERFGLDFPGDTRFGVG